MQFDAVASTRDEFPKRTKQRGNHVHEKAWRTCFHETVVPRYNLEFASIVRSKAVNGDCAIIWLFERLIRFSLVDMSSRSPPIVFVPSLAAGTVLGISGGPQQNSYSGLEFDPARTFLVRCHFFVSREPLHGVECTSKEPNRLICDCNHS